jgi:hypothetical protein
LIRKAAVWISSSTLTKFAVDTFVVLVDPLAAIVCIRFVSRLLKFLAQRRWLNIRVLIRVLAWHMGHGRGGEGQDHCCGEMHVGWGTGTGILSFVLRLDC